MMTAPDVAQEQEPIMDQESRIGASPARSDTPQRGSADSPIVLVPLDGSVHATAALPVARVLAALKHATLHIVYVAEEPLPAQGLLQTLNLTPEQRRGTVVDQIVGPPAASIVRMANEQRSVLIVMCTHTDMTKPHDALGHVAEDVLRAAPCPVVLVRPERGLLPWTLHRILLPHDGTPTAAAAVSPAMDLVHQSGAALDVLHIVVPAASRPPEPGTLTMSRYADQPHYELPFWEGEFLDRMRAICPIPPSAHTRLFVRVGTPGEVITRFARDHASDLIILAWSGSIDAERARTFKEVIHRSPCPTIVLRTDLPAPHEIISKHSV